MAFELQIANRRERAPFGAFDKRSGAFTPATRIEVVGELNDRSSRLLSERIDSEIEQHSSALLISLDRVTRTQWAALCRLVSKIQAARKRGVDVRIVRPKPSIRLLLSTIAFSDGIAVDADIPVVARSVIIG